MSDRNVLSVTLNDEEMDWLRGAAVREGVAPEAYVASLLRDQRESEAQEAMSRWVRGEHGAPSTQEIDRLRDSLLGGLRPR